MITYDYQATGYDETIPRFFWCFSKETPLGLGQSQLAF